MEVIMAASLLESSYKDLKKDTQNFIQDEEEPQDPFSLDDTQELAKSPH
jgi:hypothetical protein